MIASDLIPNSARPWLTGPKRARLRPLAPIASLLLVWWLAASQPSALLWLLLGIYAAVLIGLLGVRQLGLAERHSDRIETAATLTDLVLAVVASSGLLATGGAAYPLTALLGLRALLQRRRLSLASLAPLALMASSLIAQQLTAWLPGLAGLPSVTHLWLMITGIGLIITAVLASARKQAEIHILRQALHGERQLREQRVGELERTTNELRARMREQHALEEGLRVITSSLSLSEVLAQIVESTVSTLGRERVSGMSLSLLVDGELTNHGYSSDESGSYPWAAPLARRAMQQGVPLIVNDAIHSAEFAPLARHLRSAIAVPIYVGNDVPRGALIVVSPTAATFSSSDARHLMAFGTQAGIAIANAELHSRMREQQRLLEAVIRDINDGLVVIDTAGAVALANPIGHEILGAALEAGSARERLLSLAASAHESDQATIVAELKLRHPADDAQEGEAGQRVYQAFASRLQVDAGNGLVAVVLHDITHQRAEEQARTEFISMVSHELRNPLHSLNGFLKVVTQGRAGQLNELQQDFLEMANGQVELLKGRIQELLEFNRMKAGKLTLKPKLNDLGLLINGTVNRLSLQAEQSNIQLINLVIDDLPEAVFDSERIGQVLTNLIENAIKATPNGGRIAVSSQLRDSEVWVSVSDTGVGIAPGDIGKIFQRFYRASNSGKSVYGSHLGLGLTICQQIVEGHGGRIWVESELNVGTTFTFALPLATSDVEVATA